MPDSYNPGMEGVAQTAAPNISTVVAHNDPAAAAGALLTALGSGSTQQAAAAINADYQQRRLQEQSQKVDFYTQQIKDASEPGSAVSQAQVQKIHPELVPIIAAHISESIGKQNASQQWAQITANIDNDSSLRLDSAARTAYINDQRTKFAQSIPQGNDFYASGAMQAVDQSIQQNQQRWMNETAQFHNQVQTQQVKDDTVNALTLPTPADTAAAMNQMFEKNKVASSLSPVEVNAAAVDATIKYALAATNSDYLDRIPDKFLNVDTKEAVQRARLSISGTQMAQAERYNTLLEQSRARADLAARIEINQKAATGQQINPADYATVGNGRMMEYATQAMSQPMAPDAVSKSKAAAWEQTLFNKGLFGNIGTEDDIRASALSIPGINPSDRAAMVAKAHTIYQGAIIMDDPRVKSEFAPIDALVNQVTTSPNAKITGLDGVSLRANVVNMWRGRVRTGIQNYMEDNGGNAPGGSALDGILQVANVAATKYVKEASDIHNIGKPIAADVASPVTPKTPNGLPPGVALVGAPPSPAASAPAAPSPAPAAAPVAAPAPTPPAAPVAPSVAPAAVAAQSQLTSAQKIAIQTGQHDSEAHARQAAEDAVNAAIRKAHDASPHPGLTEPPLVHF
jgi:hypothetical protein